MIPLTKQNPIQSNGDRVYTNDVAPGSNVIRWHVKNMTADASRSELVENKS